MGQAPKHLCSSCLGQQGWHRTTANKSTWTKTVPILQWHQPASVLDSPGAPHFSMMQLLRHLLPHTTESYGSTILSLPFLL